MSGFLTAGCSVAFRTFPVVSSDSLVRGARSRPAAVLARHYDI